MPNKKKLYDALVKEGYNNFENEDAFNAYVESPENRKTLYNALVDEGFDNFEDESAFHSFLGYGESDEPRTTSGGVGTQEEADAIFDANAERYRNGQPIQRVTTQSVLDAQNKVPDSEIQRLQGIMGKAQQQIDEASFFDRFFDEETRTAVATRNKAEEALEMYEEANREKETWFDRNVVGALKGFADKVGDLSTWDFGASGVASAVALKDAVAKMEAGEKLSSAEQNLLDAYGLASAVQAAYQDKVGMAYNVGGSLPESMAFGASLALNPVGGVGKKIGEAAAKAAVKKYGTTLASKLAKGAARLGGDVIEMGVATAVPGAGRVAEDYYNRLNGQSTFDIDENGIVRYGGQVQQEEADNAIWKAIGSQFIENYSEAMGNYFAPMGQMLSNLTSKGLKAAHLGKFAEVLSDVSSSQFSKGLQRFKQATKFDGLVGEYLKEVAGNVMNAATVGDMNFNSPEDPRSVFNPETNIETFLSCALLSGTMYAVEAPVSMYNKNVAKKNLNKADTEAKRLWGDRWDDMRSQMDEADPQLLAQLLTGVQNATDLSDEQKQAAKDYGMRLMQYQGYNARRMQNVAESTSEANAINNAYDEGSDLQTPADKHQAKLAVDRAEAALGEDAAFVRTVMRGAETPVATINAMAERGYTEEQIQKAKDYYSAVNRMNGMTDALLDEVDSQIESANVEVDMNTNKELNQVIQVVLRDGSVGYVINGTVTPGNDNTIDVNKSDSNIVVRLVNGDVKWMNPNNDLASVAWIDTPQNLKANNNTVLRQSLIDNGIQEIDWNPATPNPRVGDSFEMDGIAVTIVGHDGHGGMFVLPSEEWQAAQGSEQKQQAAIAKAQQMGVVQVGMFKQWASDQLDAQEEAQAVAEEAVVQENLTTETQQPIAEGVASGDNLSPVEKTAQPQAPVIPTKEDGSIDFVSYGKEGTFKTLGEKYGEKMPNKVAVTAMALAEDLKKAQKKLEKAEEAYDNAPIGREQKAEEARDKAQQELDAIKKEADFWAEMDADIKAAQAERESMLNPQVDVDMSEQPMTVDEFVAQQLANGNITLTSESYKKETGFGEKERKKFPKMFRKAENGGMTIERAGERLMEIASEEGLSFFDQEDANAGRDALINFLGSVYSWGDVTGYVRSSREAMAKKESEAARDEMESFIWDNFHMTPEEYATQREIEGTENPFTDVNVEELDAIFALTIEEYQEYERNQSNEQGAEASIAERSNNVLSEEQADNTGRTEQGEGIGQAEGNGSRIADTNETAQAAELTQKEGESVLEFAERVAEEQRRKPLRARANEWAKALGVKVHFIERVEDVKSANVLAALKNGNKVAGWYSQVTGEVFFLMPNLDNVDEIDNTYVHEVVAHKGMFDMLGKERYDELCDKVWEMMPKSEQDKFIDYPGVNGNTRIAADEYIAHLSESLNLTPEQQGIWDKIVQFFRELFDQKLNGILSKSKLTNEDISNLIKASYANLKANSVNDVLLQIKNARKEVDTHPTEAQKEAGNYKKGHIKMDGFDITIENPKGGVRSGTDKNGKEWSITMNNDYGYIRGTEAVDGDHIDVFLSDNPTEGSVFVVDQSNEDGSFDESKVMYGFNSLEEARAAYLSNYEKGWESRIMAITGVSKEEFKKWIDSSHRKTKPFVEYKSVKTTEGQSEETNVSRMADIEARILEIEGRRNEISDELAETPDYDALKVAELRAEEWGLDQEQSELEAEYSGLRSMNDESNAILENEGSDLRFSAKKKRALETVSTSRKKHQQTVISSADGAKILNNLDNLAEKYENDTHTKEKTFIGEVAKAIEARKQGSGSQYATFETVNGNVVTIRLADHNATVSNFDNRDEIEGISIVVSAKRNNGIINDGDAHIVEYFYDSIDLRRADGKPLAEIVKSLKQALYSGEFKDTTGLAERQEVNESRFRVVNDKNGKKTLVGLHNISESKLKKAIKQGGLANPSMAVIDLDKQSHVDYGDITLIAPLSLIDKKTGKNIGTYTADAWTPIYPNIEKRMSDKGAKAYSESLESVPSELRNKVRLYFNAYLEDGNTSGALNYWFLHDTGKNPPSLTSQSNDYTNEELDTIEAISNVGYYSGLNEEEKQKVLDLFIKKQGGKDAFDARIAERIETMKNNLQRPDLKAFMKNKVEQKLQEIQEYGYDYEQVSNFYSNAQRAINNRGKIDEFRTFRNAQDIVNNEGLQGEFNEWLADKEEQFGVEEYLFVGYNNNGDRKYLPNTLENASKLMKKEGRAGATGLHGFNHFVATLAPNAGTLAQINKKKGNLSTQEGYDAFREKWGDVYHELAKQLQPNATGYADYGYYRLEEMPTVKNPKEYVKKEYGIELSDEFMKKYNEFVSAIKNDFPARYFETKFERPVYLNEFAAAVVPQGTSKDVVDALTEAGLPVEEYESGNNEARMAAVDKVSSEIGGIRFRISNRNQEIFVSNAQKAVEGIKQEKATPQQWLAMIEKNGGLKAGEDKWLGLSDWLKASDKKSITKAEILDFIGENKIVIEEVQYTEDGEDIVTYEDLPARNTRVEDWDHYGKETGHFGDFWASDKLGGVNGKIFISRKELRAEKRNVYVPLIRDRYLQNLDSAYPIYYDTFEGAVDGLNKYFDNHREKKAHRVQTEEINSTRLEYTTRGLENKAEIALTIPTIESWNEDDEIHFGDAGEGRAIAWIRFGETTAPQAEFEKAAREADNALTQYQNELADKYIEDGGSGDPTEYLDMMSEEEGKKMRELSGKMIDTRDAADANQVRVLVIDEIQSKRHQEGRDKGYRTKETTNKLIELKRNARASRIKLDNFTDSIISKYGVLSGEALPRQLAIARTLSKANEGDVAKYHELEELADNDDKLYTNYENEHGNISNRVPEAPFEKNWSELAFKRMLRYAAENGFDKVAWTKGSQQAERYNLGKVVDSISISKSKKEEGKYHLTSWDKDTIPIGAASGNKSAEELKELFGKAVADELINGVENLEEGSDTFVLEGADLEVGGEGMKGFYDKMLPAFVNKYVKKWGTKVQDIELPRVEEAGRIMHSVDVTDAMKESVMEGQVMFRISPKVRQLQEEADKFTSEYNSVPVYVIDADMSNKELEAAFDGDYSAKEIKEFMKKSKTAAAYDKEHDKIVIFADRLKPERTEEALFHENIHAIFYHGRHNNLIGHFYEYGKDGEKFAKWKKITDNKEYKSYERGEEFFAYAVSNAIVDGNLEDVLQYIENKSEFNELLNELGYDYGNRRRNAGRTGERGTVRESALQDVPSEKGREGKSDRRERAEQLRQLFDQVADMGLDGVLGNRYYGKLLMDIYQEMPLDVRRYVSASAINKYGGDFVPAMSDYLNVTATAEVWGKVVGLVRDVLRKAGFDLDLNESDVKYMLWRSQKPMKKYSALDVAEDIDARRKFGVDGDSGVRFSVKNFAPFDPSDKRNEIVKKYDAFLKKGKFNFIEAFQDRMYSVKAFMDMIVEATGKKVRDFEDAYEAENQLGSINKPAEEKYLKNFYKPIVETLNALSAKYGREAMERYIYCKSGLERNEVLRQRDADEAFNVAKEELDDKLAKGQLTQPQYDALLQQAEDQRQKTLSEDVDYSGIRGMLFNLKAQAINKEYEEGRIDKGTRDARLANLEANRKNVVKDWKTFAENEVAAIEGRASSAELKDLWKKINAATNETLRMDYESGMIDKATYDAEKNMMKYYVPLRNWADTTAEEMYEYRSELVRPVSSNQKRAKGRESQADNPIATIALMAQNAIVRGNRNKVKQKFYAFVANRETGLASVRDVWYVQDPTTGDWEAKYADTSSATDAAEFAQILDDFETDMQLLESQGLAYKGKLPLGMKFRASRQQKQSHVVPVMINGKEYAVYVNGNPRPAQAMNGETNSEAANASAWYDKIKRIYGAGLTSWNPDFIIPNMIRDGIHASTMTFLDAGPIAAARFALNGPRAFGQVFAMVSGLGKGFVNPQNQAYFEEFVANGGETGYTAIHTLEDYKKEYDKLMNEVKGLKGNFLKNGFQGAAKFLEAANRIFEDVNRFNAYVSARESGESIMRSISAAKNITVNFNRKGALSANNTVFGTIANAMSKWILFFNPAVQGIAQLVTKTKMNPKRAAAMASTILASGFFMPMINELLVAAGGDDEEDDYWNQSDFKRRNNWLLFTGDGYVSVPLPPVLRELYGIGDIIYGSITGHITPQRAVMDMARQVQSAVGFVNLIPEVSQEPDMVTWAKGFAPDIAAPVLDVISNTNFMGRPIAKWTDFNEYEPEYARVYKGVSPQWVELSKLLNKVGGDEGRRSDVWGNFINPAMMEHLFTNYGGGIGKTINNLAGMALDGIEGNTENLDLYRKSPIVPRFYIPNDEKTVVPAINRKYYDYDYMYNVAKKALKNYQDGVRSKEHPEWKRYIDEMQKNGELEFIRFFEHESKRLTKMQNLIKGNPTNKKELEEKMIDLKADIATKCYEMLK